MRRVFWKFFVIVWLAMAASIAVLFTASTLFEPMPFSHEIERGQQMFALEAASRLLARNGEAAASEFVAEAAKTSAPVNLTITALSSSQECSSVTTEDSRYVRSGDTCYRVSLIRDAAGLFLVIWPRMVPWLSALLAATVAAFWLTRQIVRPVAHLRSGLSALAKGRFDVRIGDKMNGHQDEIADLVHDFDASAARLEELQKAQQRLFHDVSHELRSPLSRLQAAIGVLQQNPGKLDAVLDRLVREVERIDGLVGEILTLARLTGRSQEGLDVQTLDVVDLLNDIVADAAFEAEARRIQVSYEGPATFVAQVNGELVYRAFENVIRNALKFTPDSSTVAVFAEQDGEILRVLVTDEGPGIPASELERIFEPFSRGDCFDNLGGYGLGLAITKQAIERHGGRVSASAAPGGGLAVAIEIVRPGRSRVHDDPKTKPS